jgi:hypothetical protein
MTERNGPGSPLPRCEHCGELIGVYEPLVSVPDGGRLTSIAAEPELLEARVALRHAACAELMPDEARA